MSQFNVYAAQINRTIQMLNDVWTSLVNKVEATKKRYKELDATMMIVSVQFLCFQISTFDKVSIPTVTHFPW